MKLFGRNKTVKLVVRIHPDMDRELAEFERQTRESRDDLVRAGIVLALRQYTAQGRYKYEMVRARRTF